ncbi:FHA domain-containing protein, partial [Nocardioides sp.]|uniref:FHA domain-containing protein n=1 Tax=Nocardioides sp. TaxID=35761 RepID=UPI002C8FE38D
APAPPAATPPSSADDDSDDAPTVLRAELVQKLGSAGIVGPSVLAVDCPNGHQTSAHEPTCRLCGADLPDDQEPRQIPRPALGALVLAGGDRLVLDKDAVLGRAPYEPEGSTERPHLLRVGDSGDISRQHARIMLDGWQVIVRDLGTANGTTLTLPGGSPQQLRANEDYQLEDGAEIGIADVVTLRYEVNP